MQYGNASYGATCCAERVALFGAISEGHEDIRGIVVVAALTKQCRLWYLPPGYDRIGTTGCARHG